MLRILFTGLTIRSSSFISIIFFLWSTNTLAESPWVKGKSGKTEARLIFELDQTSLEDHKVLAGVEIRLAPGWYTYWKNAGDVGYAPKARWNLSESWKVSSLYFPTPQIHQAPALNTSDASSQAEKKDLISYGYRSAVLYLMELSGKGALTGSLNWEYLVCEKVCIPENHQFEFEIAGAEMPIPSNYAAALMESLKELPVQRSTWKTQWKNPTTFEVEVPGATEPDLLFSSSKRSGRFWSAKKIGEDKFEITLKEPLSEISLLALGTVAYEAPIMPPPLWTSGDAASSSLLLALFFAFLGGLILNFMPCVLPVVVLKTHSLLVSGKSAKTGLMLTSLGVISSFVALGVLTGALREAGEQVGWGFQFQIPGFLVFIQVVLFLFALNLFGLFEIQLPHWMNQKAGAKSGAFFEGVFATLLATPCTAPFLGTALTYALTRSWAELLLFFAVMGIGLATPYLLFLARPSLIKRLPKPGAWMNTMKRLLAYLLLGTLVWLMYVMQSQVQTPFVVLFVAVLTLIFFFMREIPGLWKWLLVAALTVGTILASKQFDLVSAAKGDDSTETTLGFSEESIQSRLDKGEKLFVYITADWCLSCKFNEANVIKSARFQEALEAKNIQVVRIDWTKRDPAVAAYLEKFGRVGIPFAALLYRDQQKLFPELMTMTESMSILGGWNP